MDPATGRTAHIPPPGIKRPVDSYHRQLHETHGVQIEPPPVDDAVASGSGARARPDSWRARLASSSSNGGGTSSLAHVTSFFDSERLARSAVQSEGSIPAQGPGRMRWPFLGSIRSQRSSPTSPTPGPGSDAGDDDDAPAAVIELPWRPLFLRRRVLALFAVLFAALIGGLEAVLVVSDQNDGLRKSSEVSRLLWQYGVVLIFVAVAALWARVEYQAATSAPWIRMLQGPAEIDKSLLLDYVSKFPPWAMVKAAQNRDWLVAATFAVGLLLKVIIIFATALITPRLISVSEESTPITVGASFSQGNASLQDVGSLPYFAMAGLQTNNMTFPDGVSSRAAYLPFSSNRDDLTLNATVDGFVGGLDCATAALTLNEIRFNDGSVRLNVTASTNTCTTIQIISSTQFSTTTNDDLPRKFLVFQAGSCDGSAETDDQRIVVMAGTVDLDLAAIKKAKTKSSTTTLSGEISSSKALLCTPSYAITKMQVSKDPENLISIQRVRGAENTTLDGIQPWDIAAAHFDSYATDETTGDQSFAAATRFYRNEAVFFANKPMYAALAMRAQESGSPPELASLEDGAALKQLAEDYYAQYSALIARYSMTEPTTASSTGVSGSTQRRLIVRSPPTHLMAGLLAVCILTTVAIIFITPTKGFLPRDPSSLVDVAAIVAHSHPLVECLRGMGAASEEAIRTRLNGSAYTTGAEGHEKLGDDSLGYFHIFGGKEPPRNAMLRRAATVKWRQPVFFHGLIRLLYAIILASVIIGFEVSLRASERYDGLRTIGNDDAYMAWTVVPALVLLSIALYMSEVDWWARVLAPFARLSRQGEFRETVGLNLVDVSGPLAMWRAFKLNNIAVLFTIFGMSLAALFTVASAALFEPVSVDTATSVVLKTEDFFANSLASSSDDPICTQCNNDTLAASMILVGDAPYPNFTFQDLNLPSVSLDDQNSTDDLKLSVRLTAIRPNMTCRLYLSREISTNLTLEYTTDDNIVNPLQVDLNGETCRGSSGSDDSNAIIGTANAAAQRDGSDADDGAFFGVGLGKSNSTSQCSDWVYVWGRLANTDSDKISVSSINALACNETIQAIETDVNLYGAGLHIDSADPPVPDEMTVQDTSVAIPDLDYSSLVNVAQNGLFDAFFAMLNASDYAASEDSLGGSTAANAGEVRSAILRQHGVIRAQSLNFKSRRHLSSSGTFPAVNGQDIKSGVNPEASVSEAVPLLNGDSMSQQVRLRQGVVATRILQCLVGAVLLLHILAWMFMPKNRLPRSPTNIASVTALLVDGNLLRILPRAAQWQPRREAEQALRESELAERFEMGWTTTRVRTGRDGRKVKIEGGSFGIRALAAGEWGPREELEMRPMERRSDARRPPGRSEGRRKGKSTDMRPINKPLPVVHEGPLPEVPSERSSSVPRTYLNRRPSEPASTRRPPRERRPSEPMSMGSTSRERRPSEQTSMGSMSRERRPSAQTSTESMSRERRVREQKSTDSGPPERLGMVRRGTATLEADEVQRRSVAVGDSQRVSTMTTGGRKELVKVWWAS
ncbi:hypothetical protein AK830_g6219 [Neonectria ditissima]|uniref:Uncharacterized protein n=1 Tax=Neonectria ditissima TaxID=78410 RepID=A0A0P7BHA8_9HYPO|nr:hypothetical protein AK830_g6219 [Neonectria ditissima]